jgi:putative methyltransferase (TIGR04325 family)
MSYFTRMVKETLANSSVGGWLGRVPFVEAAYGRYTLNRTDHANLFHGIYESYEEALANIPASRLSGWDHEASASIWVDNIHQLNPFFIQPSSYATLFSLSRLMREGISLIDYGGSIGLTYYRYTRFMSLPANARWIVVEVPKIVAEGRRVAAREAAVGLEFETAIEAAPVCDILFSAGSLQFIEPSVPGLLEMRKSKPPHVILNKVPLTPGEAYWTLHNYGPAVSPYRIYNEAEFLGYFENSGYVIKDRWTVPELTCYVPFHPERFVPIFAGLHFEMQT